MRLKFVVFLFATVWIVLLVRIYFLSIKSNSYYEELAERNTIRLENIVPVRGLMLDRNGEPLAVNTLGFKIAIEPHLSSKKRQAKLENEIKTILKFFPDLSLEELKKTYTKRDSPYNHDFVTVIDFVSYEKVHEIYPVLAQYDSIKILPSTKRYYPNENVASHIIGYVGKANADEVADNEIARISGFIGKNGLEKYYNTFLEGELGYRKIKVTAFNKEIEEIEKKLPEESNNLVLTIDIRLQKFIHNIYKDNNLSGVVTIMDINNGEILAAISYPEYDINAFTEGISQKEWENLITHPDKPFTNKFIAGLYPPGSTIKPGVALSFLEYGGITEDTTVFCTGEFEVGGRKFRCWKEGGHGAVDMKRAIRESCDDYFYKMSLKTGIDKIANVMSKFGFGEKTGIDLPNEFSGVLPSTTWKRQKYNESWYIGETLVSAIGQGYFLVTPLQLTRFSAAIANGKLVTPRLVKKMGKEELSSSVIDIFNDFEKSKLPKIREAMYEVANAPGGTASRVIKTGDIKVSGKTGTAQVVSIPQEQKKRIKEEDMAYYHRSHAWFIAYFPSDKPKYAMTVLVEHGGHGGEATGWITTSIVNEMNRLGYFN